MKCLSCQIMWSDPLNKYKSNVCPFCNKELPNDKEIRNEYISNGFDIQDGTLLRYLGDGGIVSIPECVSEIGYGAFAYCRGLNKLILPASATTISTWAFYECNNLKEITCPNILTNIENSAFLRCVSLEQISISNSVTKISDRAFAYCTSLPSDVVEKIKEINKSAI